MGSNPLFATYQPGSMEITMRGTTLEYFYNGEKHFSVEIPMSKDFSIKIGRTVANDVANAEFCASRGQDSNTPQEELLDANGLAKEAEEELISQRMETMIQLQEKAADSMHHPINVTKMNHATFVRNPARQAVTQLLQCELVTPPQPVPASIYLQAVNHLTIQQERHTEVEDAALTQKNRVTHNQDDHDSKATSRKRPRGRSGESARKRAIENSGTPRRRSARKCVRLRRINYSETQMWRQKIKPGWSSSHPIALDSGMES